MRSHEGMRFSDDKRFLSPDNNSMNEAATANKPLFEKLGGKAAVEAAVDRFYDKLVADSRVKHFFDGIDLPRQRAKQKLFLTYAFGGLPSYPGSSLRKSHERLVQEKGLNDMHFDAVAENLQKTLEELGVAPALIAEVMEIAGSTRNEVLSR